MIDFTQKNYEQCEFSFVDIYLYQMSELINWKLIF